MLFDPKWKSSETKIPEWQLLLDEAASLIKTHGWVQGRVGSKYSGYCMIGALQQAAFGRAITSSFDFDPANLKYENVPAQRYNAYKQAGAALIQTVGSRGIWQWNDAKGRRKFQVLKAFEEAKKAFEKAKKESV